jgi:hypothetical protein
VALQKRIDKRSEIDKRIETANYSFCAKADCMRGLMHGRHAKGRGSKGGIIGMAGNNSACGSA